VNKKSSTHRACATASILLLSACGGGGSGTSSTPPPPPPPPASNLARVSAGSSFAAGCNGAPQTGIKFTNAEVEPSVIVNPVNPTNIVGAWQQDRWSSGGSQGLVIGSSFDGGHTWAITSAAFSRCTGGNAANGGDFERASDPWLAVSPNGTMYALSLSFSGEVLQPGSSSGMLVSRSTDGGMTWGPVSTLIRDDAQFFNDKGSVTADPTDANFAYAIWDRLSTANDGPAWFARTVDGGVTWEAAHAIFDPGAGNQTLGNLILVQPTGPLVNVFIEIDAPPGGAISTNIRAIRSPDHGSNWSNPVTIAESQSIGAIDPQTGAGVRDGSDLFSAAVDRSGTLYVVWQDSRFSFGAHDGIALSRSTDGGLNWSAPVRVNDQSGVAAFTPAVHVRDDGVIGVTYYDFRNDTSSAATLLTDYWLATSTDGVSFTESHLTGPFDLDRAPNADGLFLGDYQALASVGSDFRPFFVQTNASAGNPTDVFIAFGPDR
jgi:hypothetical protein